MKIGQVQVSRKESVPLSLHLKHLPVALINLEQKPEKKHVSCIITPLNTYFILVFSYFSYGGNRNTSSLNHFNCQSRFMRYSLVGQTDSEGLVIR